MLAEIGKQLGIPLTPGGYLFATIHRAQNRTRGAMAGRGQVPGLAASTVGVPVVLAVHPGSPFAVTGEEIVLPPAVAMVGPQGYRTSLALRLDAAALALERAARLDHRPAGAARIVAVLDALPVVGAGRGRRRASCG